MKENETRISFIVTIEEEARLKHCAQLSGCKTVGSYLHDTVFREDGSSPHVDLQRLMKWLESNFEGMQALYKMYYIGFMCPDEVNRRLIIQHQIDSLKEAVEQVRRQIPAVDSEGETVPE